MRELGAVELQSAQYDAAAEHLAAAADGDPCGRGRARRRACSWPTGPVEAVAALSRAIDALTDEQRELGLLLQATRGAASQGNRAAAALARERRLPVRRARRRPAHAPASGCSSPASPTARR